MVKITGLWETKDKKGNTMLSGNLTHTSRVVILKNGFKKEGSTEPDFHMFFDEKEIKKEDEKEEKSA
ncbi:MAG: hypothetical protein JW780_06095 [Clostridiales bacterium]|nr:hypothetical protein [Clostridiales bacterium]